MDAGVEPRPHDARAVIVGTAGIAAASAHALATLGFRRFTLLYRSDRDRADRLAGELGDRGADAIRVQADVRDWESLSRLEGFASGPTGALVYAAGDRWAANIAPERFTRSAAHDAFDIYAMGFVGCVTALAPTLVDGASLVAMSGSSARAALSESQLLMGVTKAALEHAVRYLARWLAPRGVRVNAVNCGPVHTDSLAASMTKTRLAELVDHMSGRIPLGRVAQPGDIADVVAFLCSDQARWVTGDVIYANGGEHVGPGL